MRRFHSTKWRSSVQPRKQRKYFHNAPLHLKGAQLHAHLSKELRQRHGRRSLRVRTGDTIKVLRGMHKGKQGKVERVNVKRGRIYVSKVETPKRQGGASRYPLRPSNCMIVELTADKRRFTAEKKQKARTPGGAKAGSGAQSTVSGAPATAPSVQRA
jgi:large subunit ribosomal protein L24